MVQPGPVLGGGLGANHPQTSAPPETWAWQGSSLLQFLSLLEVVYS